MITKPTLFILGAGASIPYGFPSGAALRDRICEAADNKSSGLAYTMFKHSGFNVEQVYEFATAFRNSRLASIDAFLSKRREFSDIGKLVIAALLIPNEREYEFNLTKDDDWYFYLWNALVSNVSDISELSHNQLQIFTFNYDRSLERYLHIAIMNTFNVGNDEAIVALSGFNIQHVYGSLGLYGHVDDFENSVRAYLGDNSKEAIEVAASEIRVIPEARSDDEIFVKAKEAFLWAKHVCFLGFGFDTLNVERLGFKDLAMQNSVEYLPSKIITSAYGKTFGEIELARELILGDSQTIDDYGKTLPEWDYAEKKNLSTLRDFAWLLQ
jgi:hypothetical protein